MTKLHEQDQAISHLIKTYQLPAEITPKSDEETWVRQSLRRVSDLSG